MHHNEAPLNWGHRDPNGGHNIHESVNKTEPHARLQGDVRK